MSLVMLIIASSLFVIPQQRILWRIRARTAVWTTDDFVRVQLGGVLSIGFVSLMLSQGLTEETWTMLLSAVILFTPLSYWNLCQIREAKL